MKNLIIGAIAIAATMSACKKSNSSSSSNNGTVGISAVVNGQYTTFNRNISVDTSSDAHEIGIVASGDSTPFKSSILELVVTGPGPGLVTPHLYTYTGYDYTGGLGIATTINYSQVLFGSNDDEITVTAVTDSSITGTFHGNIHGTITNFNDLSRYDSVITCTDGKFFVKW